MGELKGDTKKENNNDKSNSENNNKSDNNKNNDYNTSNEGDARSDQPYVEQVSNTIMQNKMKLNENKSNYLNSNKLIKIK
jgi:flagellar biosynthesis/type III secretory pathway M-ring protein FliF/YscJ